MNDLSKWISRSLFYALALILLIWTSSLTISFISRVLPNAFWMLPLLALVQFDIGQISWLFVFLRYARGSGQRAIALLACLTDFIGVGLISIAEILIGGQTLIQVPLILPTIAVWGVGIWAILNLGCVIAFHLFDPDIRREMALRVETDAVQEEALQRLANLRAQHGGTIAEQMAQNMMNEITAQLASRSTRPEVSANATTFQPNGNPTNTKTK